MKGKSTRDIMEEKNTEELLKIWKENNRRLRPDAEFEAIRIILIERGVSLPTQKVYSTEDRTEATIKNDSYFTVTLFLVGVTVLFIMSLSAYLARSGMGIWFLVWFLVVIAYSLNEGLSFRYWKIALVHVFFVILLTGVGRLFYTPPAGSRPVGGFVTGVLVGVMFVLPFFGLGALLRHLSNKRGWKISHYTSPKANTTLVFIVPGMATLFNILVRNFISPPNTRHLLWLAHMLNKQTALFAALDVWTVGSWVVAFIWLIRHYIRSKKTKQSSNKLTTEA